MDQLGYPAVIYDDLDGFEVYFLDLPDCPVTADSLEEARLSAVEALADYAELLAEEGETLPPPSPADAPLPDWLAEDHREPVERLLVPLEPSTASL
ncbi:MAG TPA: type II toxin-antitoxin system HicB family antitoxin [Roseomonas sp.]|jgi:predicted RNase H-like HicB family nuclease